MATMSTDTEPEIIEAVEAVRVLVDSDLPAGLVLILDELAERADELGSQYGRSVLRRAALKLVMALEDED